MKFRSLKLPWIHGRYASVWNPSSSLIVG